MSQPVARITANLEPCIAILLEKLRISDWSLERLMSVSVTYFQGSAMATTGKWRESHSQRSIVPSLSSADIAEATQT